MKLELKTEKENYSKSFSHFFGIVFFITLIIILCDVSLKLRIVSTNHKIEYNCKTLFVEKSKSNFKKLSKISKLQSRQTIWEFCKVFIK